MYITVVYFNLIQHREQIFFQVIYGLEPCGFIHLVRMQNFWKNYFLPPDTQTNVYVLRGKKC